MGFKEIKIDNTNSYYKTKLNNIDINQLIKDINLNISISKRISLPTSDTAGTQTYINIKTPTISILNKKIYNKIFNFLGYNNSIPYYSNEWVYISDSRNEFVKFHTHVYNDIITKSFDWTFVFYIQMPDNLKKNEGKLSFKTNNGTETSFLPKVGELIMFSSKLLHKPELNPNSNIERIVYAGSLAVLEYDDIKTKKTVI